MTIQGKFGIKMSDSGGKKWGSANLQLVFNSLNNINNAMNGRLQSLAGGSTLKLAEHVQVPDHPELVFNGQTSGTSITFATKDSDAIRQINIYHEFGHLLNNVPGKIDVFSNTVAKLSKPSWVSEDKKINPEALLSLRITNDPNYPSVGARQAYRDFGPNEQWADAFANYVAGNINLERTEGIDMFNFVNDMLSP
jgi:hypothetical protein